MDSAGIFGAAVWAHLTHLELCRTRRPRKKPVRPRENSNRDASNRYAAVVPIAGRSHPTTVAAGIRLALARLRKMANGLRAAPQHGLALVDNHSRLGPFGLVEIFRLSVNHRHGIALTGATVQGGKIGGKL